MDRGRFNLSSWMVRRGLVYVMVIGCLVLVGMPTRDVGSMPRQTGNTVLFGPGSAVGASTSSVMSLAAGDLDNDGDLDIVSGSASAEDYKLIAWENDGTPFADLWTQHDVGASGYPVESVALGDLDNDGDLDIVSTTEGAGEVTAWQNDGTPFTDSWSYNDVGIYGGPPVSLADLDNDGDLDIVSAFWSVKAWENDGSPFSGPWAGNEVGGQPFVWSAAVGDLDGDGDADVVSATGSYDNAQVMAWQNDGTPFSDPWTRQDVGGSADTVQSLALGDLDNDGDLDIVSRSDYYEDYEVISWENDGTPFDDLWSQNDVGVARYCSVALGDLDGDGDLDIVSGKGSKVLDWGNDGDPFAGLWSQHPVGTTTATVLSVALGDLDADGDLDVVSGSSSQEGYEVMAWENTSLFGVWVPFVAQRFPYFCDDFSDPSSGWYAADTGNVKYGYVGGEYEILLRKTSWMGAVAAPTRAFANGTVEADVRLHRGTTGAYGLIFGLKDWDHFYLFIVDPGIRYWSLWRAEPTTWVPLVDWIYSPYIRPYAANHLKVERDGNWNALFVNGHLVKRISDWEYLGTLRTGLCALTWDEQPVAVRFDNFCAHPSGATTEVDETSAILGAEASEGRGPIPAPGR